MEINHVDAVVVFKATRKETIIMSIDKGYIDTPISGVTTLAFSRGLVNYAKDFNVVEDEPEQVKITNLTSPLDRPETFRFAYSQIKDIYSSADVHPNVQAPSKRGVSLLVQLTNTISDVDAVTGSRVDLPMSAHMVLKFPANAAITPELVADQIGRLISGLYETGSLTTDRLKSMMRGSLLPKDI